MSWKTIIIIAATALITGLVQHFVRAIFAPEKREIAPQPLLVRQDPEYVTSGICTRNHLDFLTRLAELESRTDKLEEKFTAIAREITSAAEERVRRLHQRIDTVCTSIEGDLKNIPEQIISILKNTGAI